MTSKKTYIIRLSLAWILISCLVFLSSATAGPRLRIVSLSPSITYNIQQMGAQECIVGRTSYCPGADSFPASVVGNVLEVQLEKIITLQPDIVFCMSFTKPEIIQTLEKLGIKVHNLPTPRSFEEICQQAEFIGKEIGYGQQAQVMVDSEKKSVARIRQEFKDKHNQAYRTFFQIGSSPVFPVIEGTFMQDYLSMLGLDNIVKKYKGGGISKEYVVAARPEIMIISKMSGMGQHVMKEWMTFSQIPAIAQGHIFLIDDTKACCPSPLFFRETLETIARYLETEMK